LAQLAKVSTPTVSRFESGDNDIKASSALHILSVLGMTDKRELSFPDPEPRYDFNREVVLFNGMDKGKTINCAISREALEDHFEADNTNLVKIFHKHHETIEHFARRKYFTEQGRGSQVVLIRTEDVS
jgi:transcriptional regulator with XRE-family HTH domain